MANSRAGRIRFSEEPGKGWQHITHPVVSLLGKACVCDLGGFELHVRVSSSCSVVGLGSFQQRQTVSRECFGDIFRMRS